MESFLESWDKVTHQEMLSLWFITKFFLLELMRYLSHPERTLTLILLLACPILVMIFYGNSLQMIDLWDKIEATPLPLSSDTGLAESCLNRIATESIQAGPFWSGRVIFCLLFLFSPW